MGLAAVAVTGCRLDWMSSMISSIDRKSLFFSFNLMSGMFAFGACLFGTITDGGFLVAVAGAAFGFTDLSKGIWGKSCSLFGLGATGGELGDDIAVAGVGSLLAKDCWGN